MERGKARRAFETAQEKEEQLRDRASSAAQNTEQRQVTLDHVRNCQRQGLATVTNKQREARLQRMRDSQNIQRQSNREISGCSR